MAAGAAEALAVADGTALLHFDRHLAAGVNVEEAGDVGFGHESHGAIVTLPATVGNVGLVVAGHACGHRREVRLAGLFRCFDPDVTGRTGAEPDVDLMIEVRQRGDGRRFDRRIRMARQTHSTLRKIIVFSARASRYRSVARGAFQLLRQVQAM